MRERFDCMKRFPVLCDLLSNMCHIKKPKKNHDSKDCLKPASKYTPF